MLEVRNELSDQSDVPNDSQLKLEFKDLKLPRIDRIVSYQRHKKITTKLPLIKNSSCSQYTLPDSDQVLEQQDFVVSVEKRLRMILQEQNMGEVGESEDSGEDNFERQINQNKEIIRQLRRRNQQNQRQNGQANFVEKANPKCKATPMLSHRHANMMFKKHQMKERSLEGKSDKRRPIFSNLWRKQSWKERNKITPLKEESETIQKEIERMPGQVHSKDGLIRQDKILPTPIHKKHSLFGQPKLTKQFSHKILTPVQKNEQLFDAIHNYLQNPKRSEQVLNPIKLSRNKEELSEKLRQYQQQLTQLQYNTCEEKAQKENIIPGQKGDRSIAIGVGTSCQWRKISLNGSGVLEQSSSFDSEMERMKVYVTRNDKSLEKYVLNQKMLLDMQLLGHRERVCTQKDVGSGPADVNINLS